MRVIILYKRFTRRALPFGFIQTKASPFFHGRRSLCSRLSRLPRLIVSPKWSVFRRFVLTQVLEWDFLKWSSVCLAAVAGVSDRKRRGVLAFIARFFRFPLCLLSVLFYFCLFCLFARANADFSEMSDAWSRQWAFQQPCRPERNAIWLEAIGRSRSDQRV